MKYKFLKSLDLDPAVYIKVSLGLDRVVSGNDNVLISPLGERVGPGEVLASWDKIFQANSSKLNDSILQIEVENRSKYGPRSIAVPWSDRSSGVDSYFSPEVSKLVPAQVEGNPRLRPIALEQGIKLLKNNTNSGLPFVRRKGEIKDTLAQDFYGLLERKDPCLLFTRTQENNKTRNVWGYPIADTLNEMLYYKPLLDYQRKLSWRAALQSPVEVDMAVTKLLKLAQSRNKYLVSIDFSAYDASVKTTLQRKAFEYISGLFQKQYKDKISQIADRFNTIGLVTPSGIREGPHGVPSGSTFTNEVDSIAQYLCAKSFNLADNEIQVQGDDGLYLVDDPDEFFGHMKNFGLLVNESKSSSSKEECNFLQNYYSLQYIGKNEIVGGIYSTYRALSRIVYLERFTKIVDSEILGRDYFAIRTISILENCRHHPLFEELVKYIYKLDKYDLAFSKQGLREYVRDYTESTGIEGIFNYRYGDDVKGIETFKSFQLIAKLNSGLVSEL
jgi:hypothetical protein